MSGRRAFAALMALVVAVVIGLVVYFARDQIAPYVSPDRCEATAGDYTASLDLEQAHNAGLIAAISVRRGMPARAASIALATAMQESKLRNLDHGDRDSLGLFQQRPSQGWGSARQIMDPIHAINAFYDALDRVDGYASMPITEAAQQVQHSGFPEAYAVHEGDARTLASALTGNSRAAFSCEIDADAPAAADKPHASGLVTRAVRARRDVREVFGAVPAHPAGVSGRAFELTTGPGSDGITRRWALASYLLSQADRLKIESVTVGRRIWSAGEPSGDGWRHSSAARPADGVRVVVAR